MAIFSHKNILWLQITIYDTKHVQVFKSQKNLCYIKLGSLFGEILARLLLP